nr:unnamed protein product [Callosobruchus analis]
MSDKSVFLTLSSVFKYLCANTDSRCITEGEEILNANHIILMGVVSDSEEYVELLALCLQTSALKGSPHEIKGKLILGDVVTISNFTCICKAGLSGRCKHISAVLLKCTRSSIASLEILSSTDVKCYWSYKKKAVEEQYEGRPILETPCYESKVKKLQSLSQEAEKECLNLLLSACPDSNLACHLKGRNFASMQSLAHQMSEDIKTITEYALKSKTLEEINIDIASYNLKPCCANVVQEIMDLTAFDNAVLSAQYSDIWKQERQFRITDSRCYSVYTFAKDKWSTMTRNFFWPKPFTSRYTDHGIKYEKEALIKYTRSNNYKVIELGLVICKQLPWIAYSPDGVVMADGAPTRLVEIKCPYDGVDNDAINFIHTCAYLEINSGTGITLKTNHKYYGQVQLGMAILNLPVCDLILYSVKSKGFLNICVPFDEVFVKKLLYTISEKYFINMIHFICENRAQY